jgi:release factor glutamine methyltransferase
VVVTRDDVSRRLRAAGCVYAEDEADVILATATSDDEVRGMVARRCAGEPLEYVVGWAELCGVRVRVDPGVFVPRRRSELLVREAVAAARVVTGRRPVVVDLCCGTGALGLAVAAQVECILYASDLDPVAVACAHVNVAATLDGAPGDGPAGVVYEGDLFEALPWSLRGRVDVLVVNAPYVPSGEIALLPVEAREHEARVALDGGDDGVALHRRVAGSSCDWLSADGVLLIETSRRQESLTCAAMHAGGLRASSVHDDELDACVVLGRRASALARVDRTA